MMLRSYRVCRAVGAMSAQRRCLSSLLPTFLSSSSSSSSSSSVPTIPSLSLPLSFPSTQSIQDRHMSQKFEASTRRKKAVQPVETVDMAKLAAQTFLNIQDYVEPLLVPNNYSFSTISLDDNVQQLVLHVGAKGSYKFHYSPVTGRFIYLSPISGSQQYVYDIDVKQWVGSRDGHDFMGLLTRDLIRHSIGLPKIT